MSWLLAGAAALLAVAAWLLLGYRNGHGEVQARPVAARPDESRAAGVCTTRHIQTPDDETLEAWLYTPRAQNAPLVILAPGLAGTKEVFLERFAWRFVEAGFAALAFDYRCFGGSSGWPRHWVDPFRHAEDYETVLEFALERLAAEDRIDPARVLLWGSSFSGGTVLEVAARRPGLAGVIAQAPYLETTEQQTPSRLEMLRYGPWAVLDRLRMSLGIRRPVYMPVYGRPGEFAFARSREHPSVDGTICADTAAFFGEVADPARGGWENLILARFLADFDRFDPLAALERVRCPVLLVAARADDLTPAACIHAAARTTRADARVVEFDCGHFDIYTEGVFEANAASQLEFARDAVGAETDLAG